MDSLADPLAQENSGIADEEDPADAPLDAGAAAYQNGNYGAAVSLYRKAAALGSITAMSNLGYCYYYGRGVPEDPVKARGFFEKAAAGFDVSATYKLGDMRLYGLGGFAKDENAALGMYEKAYSICVRSGRRDVMYFPDVCLRLAGAYRNGRSVLALRLVFSAIDGFRARIAGGDRLTGGPLSKALRLEDELLSSFDGGSEEERALLEDVGRDTYSGVRVYFADSALSGAEAARYSDGLILREPEPLELRASLPSPAGACCFAVLSNHAAVSGGSISAEADSRFKVLGRLSSGGRAVIFLLHLPDSELRRLIRSGVTGAERRLVSEFSSDAGAPLGCEIAGCPPDRPGVRRLIGFDENVAPVSVG